MNTHEQDELYMHQALTLAAETAAEASPNPQVGCVLVNKSRIVGQGAHRYAARDHAEIVALKQAAAAGHSVAGATAYVTLEPCSHHGRTGPCADALIAARIARCVVATVDPNPEVSGRGLARLRAAGIEVTLGICEAEARTLNDAFAFAITRGRPFVTLKAALSTDGMLAPEPARRQPGPDGKPQPHWLTGPSARAEVQQLRHASDAILTGIGTVLADNPALTDRTGLPRRRPLQRIVPDSQLRIPPDCDLVRSAHGDLHLFCGPNALPEQAAPLRVRGIRITEVSADPTGPLNLHEVLEHLHREDITSVLLEAGSTLNAAFLAAGLIDQAILYYAPIELGPASIPFARNGPTPFALEQQFLSVNKQAVGDDIRVSGLIHNPWPAPTQVP